LLPLLGEETLLQSTVARLGDLFPPERILIVSVQTQADEIMHLPDSWRPPDRTGAARYSLRRGFGGGRFRHRYPGDYGDPALDHYICNSTCFAPFEALTSQQLLSGNA
jgi:hypothetical protein